MRSKGTAMRCLPGIFFSFILAFVLCWDASSAVKEQERDHGRKLPGTSTPYLNAEDAFRRAVTLFRAESYAEAHKHLLTIHKKDPDNTTYMGLLGWTYFKQGNLKEAERLFSAVHAKTTKDIGALQGSAWLTYMRGQLEDSERWFNKEMDWAQGHIDENNWRLYKKEERRFIRSVMSDGYYGLGLIFLARRDFSNAQAHLEKALGFRNDFIGHGPIKKSLGDVLYIQGEYQKAADIYRESLRERKDELLLLKLAWCQYFTDDKGGAEDLFRRGLKTARDRRPFLYGLVFATHTQGKTAEAVEPLRELLSLDPYFADTFYLRQIIEKTKGWKTLWKAFAGAYLERGDYEQAFDKLKGYIPGAGDDCEALLMEAWCHVYMGRYSTGLSKFNALATRKDCSASQCQTGRGEALLYMRRLKEAKYALNKAHQIDPANMRAKVALGAVAYLERNYQEAIRLYTKSLHLLPKEDRTFSWPSHALNNLGWSYIYTGRYVEALEVFKRLKGYHPRPIYPAVCNGLGWVYLYLEREDDAKKAFQEALRLDPKNALALSGFTIIRARR